MRVRLLRLLIALSLVWLPVTNCSGTGMAASSCCCKNMSSPRPAAPPMPCCTVEPAPDTHGTLASRVLVEQAAALAGLPAPPFRLAAIPTSPFNRTIAIAATGPPGFLGPLRV